MVKGTFMNVLNPLSVKTLCSSEESYIRCVEYGKSKAHCSKHIFLYKAILAGIFVGLCAHASGIAGGLFYYHKIRELCGSSLAAFFYSFTFPIAFMCIICTGSDLFTGNTLAVTTALYQKKVKILEYIQVMTISIFGNYIGSVGFAFLISHGSGAFTKNEDIAKNHFYQFLNNLAVKKVSHTFIECICLAIACNMFVCLSLYFIISIKDGSGVVLSVFFGIFSFAISGLEHTIANFYTLHISLFSNANISVYEIYIKNLLPTLIGNYIAGGVVLAIPLFFIYKSTYAKYEDMNKSIKNPLNSLSIDQNDDANIKIKDCAEESK